jgi:hypothetical protein
MALSFTAGRLLVNEGKQTSAVATGFIAKTVFRLVAARQQRGIA